MALEQNFVSARTIKRHHHVCVCVCVCVIEEPDGKPACLFFWGGQSRVHLWEEEKQDHDADVAKGKEW